MTDEIPDAVRESLSLLTIEQVCELLQVEKTWVWKNCNKGRFPYVKVGKYLRFKPAEVQAYLDGTWQQVVPTPVLEVVPTAPRRGRPRKAM